MKLERKPDKLGDILVSHKMSSREDVDAAIEESKKTHERFGTVLVRRGAASQEDVNWALASQFNISYMPVSQDQVDPEIVRIVPEEMARRHHLLPLLKVANDLIVIVADPLQQAVFDDIERLTGLDLSICLGKAGEIKNALDSVYGTRAAGTEAESSVTPLSARFSKDQLAELATDATGAGLMDRLIKEACDSGSETVHLDRIGSSTLVRARISGRLEPWLRLSGDLGSALSTRVRVLAGIGAGAELGASGNIRKEIDGRVNALAVSILPAFNGESIILRPQREAMEIPPLEKMGFTPGQLEQVRSILGFRRGLIVTTGPRASGKTTTLYAIFNEADPLAEKLVTIEDEPVGASDRSLSMRVQPGSTLNAIFEAALAADPDAILIQPIPGAAVIERIIHEALQSVKIGIQLPYPDVAAALSFLTNSDVPAPAVSGALAAAIAQRIVRRLCDKCKKPDTAPEGLKLNNPLAYRAEGCQECNGTGYSGRVAIYEVVIPTAGLRAALGAKPDAASIRRNLAELNIITLRDRAIALYSEGITSAEEIAEFIQEPHHG